MEKRYRGDGLILVDRLPSSDSKFWFFKVREVDGYEFIYLPVIPSVYVDNGAPNDDPNPDAKIFRFVGNPMAKFTSGGEPNLKANFIVVAYKPERLLSISES